MNLLRILTIDRCLRDTSKKWTLKDLISACDHTEKNSKRSVQADLELMRNQQIGYSAPIIVIDKKYYKYSDENYNILKYGLSNVDKKNIEIALDVINNYCYFDELKAARDKLSMLHSEIANLIKITPPTKETSFSPKSAIEIRLWVNNSFANQCCKNKIHSTQVIEQTEIDGSINILIKTPITSKLEKFLLDNIDTIVVTSPISLKKHISSLH